MNESELRATEGFLLGNFGMDLSLVISKTFWLESFSWILDWKCVRRFGLKFSVGSQLGHPDGLLRGDYEEASCWDRPTEIGW